MIKKIKQQLKKKKINKKRMKTQTQQGSGFFADLFGLEENNKTKIDNESKMSEISKVRRSETMFINSWENLHEATKRLKTSYAKHLENLELLDDVYNIKGLSTTFKSIIMPNDVNNKEEINRVNPLLLRNYLLSGEAPPRVARKEHLLSLARYVIKKFTMGDEVLIDNINVTLSGVTAKYKIELVNGDVNYIEIKVDDDYMIDINKFQKELIKIFKKMKTQLEFDIEVVEDFKLGEEPMVIPGLDFLDQEDGIEQKLIGLQNSVRGENNSIVPLSKLENKSSERDKDMIFSLPKLPSEKKSDRFAKELSIGIDQGLNNVRQLDKKPVDVEEKLAKIMEGGPEGLLKVSSENSSSNSSKKSKYRRSKKKSYRHKFNSNSSSRKSTKSVRRSKKKNYSAKNNLIEKPKSPVQEKIDKMNKLCGNYSNNKEQCNKTIGCFYNKKKEICHVNKKVLIENK